MQTTTIKIVVFCYIYKTFLQNNPILLVALFQTPITRIYQRRDSAELHSVPVKQGKNYKIFSNLYVFIYL